MSSLTKHASGEPEVGDLTLGFVSEDVTWEIPGVFSLPFFVDYSVDSPPFSFANATWCLRMYPNGERKTQTYGYIDLMIVKLRSSVPKQAVFYKICFRTNRGREFQSCSSSSDFDSLLPEEGALKYLERRQLLAKQDLLTSNGTVTVFCRMSAWKSIAVDAHSQTELHGLVQDVDNEARLPVFTYDDKLLQDFRGLLLSEEDTDVTIRVKEREFRAHRSILRARSSVFASMFRNDMKERATGIVDVEDCEPDIFPDFLQFLYCGRVENLTAENVFGLHATADKYDVQNLKTQCVEFLKKNLSVDTFGDAIALSLQYSERELIKLANDFFRCNMPKIIVTVKWQAFLLANPIQSNELMIKAMPSYKFINS